MISVGVKAPGSTITLTLFAYATTSDMNPGLVKNRAPASTHSRADSSSRTVPAPTAMSG